MPKSDLYIGVLSGTSADSIDALLVDFSNSIEVIDRFSKKIPKAVKNKIFELVLNKKITNYANRQTELDDILGELIGKSVNQLNILSTILLLYKFTILFLLHDNNVSSRLQMPFELVRGICKTF